MFDTSPVDTGRKLNVHKTFTRRLMYVQFTSCVYGEFESFPSHISINDTRFLIRVSRFGKGAVLVGLYES